MGYKKRQGIISTSSAVTEFPNVHVVALSSMTAQSRQVFGQKMNDELRCADTLKRPLLQSRSPHTIRTCLPRNWRVAAIKHDSCQKKKKKTNTTEKIQGSRWIQKGHKHYAHLPHTRIPHGHRRISMDGDKSERTYWVVESTRKEPQASYISKVHIGRISASSLSRVSSCHTVTRTNADTWNITETRCFVRCSWTISLRSFSKPKQDVYSG